MEVRERHVEHDASLQADCPNARRGPIEEHEARDWTQRTTYTLRTHHGTATAQARVSCYWCRSERRKRQSAHRRRPDLPIVHGGCQLCEGELSGRRRSWCSDECADVWLAAASGDLMRRHLVELHGWTCWQCGTQTDTLEVDHVRPLWALTEEQRTQPRWWLPYNVQLLCHDCHRAKTRAEAAIRARRRRQAQHASPGR